MQRTGTIWTFIKEGHIRVFLAKFCQNPFSSLGDDVLWSNCWRHTTQDRSTSNGQNKSPWANDSGELKIHSMVRVSSSHKFLSCWKFIPHPHLFPSLLILGSIVAWKPCGPWSVVFFSRLGLTVFKGGTSHYQTTRVTKNKEYWYCFLRKQIFPHYKLSN